MEAYRVPANEKARLAALADLQILDTAAEKIFDSITQLATEYCGIPISLIVLVDKDRQWFKSTYGVPNELKDVRETPREISFCSETILQDDLLEINDLSQDTRFDKNPFVTQFPNIRFYAGVPLATAGGMNVGTICLLDNQPRKLTDEQKTMLKYLSKIIITIAEAKRNLSDMTLLGEALENSYNEIYIFDKNSLKCIYANQLAASFKPGCMKDPSNTFTLLEKFKSFTHANFRNLIAPLESKDKEFILTEATTQRENGSDYLAELRIQLSYAKNDPTVIVVANDITERKAHEQHILNLNLMLEHRVEERTASLENSLGLIKATLESTTDGILVVDNAGQVSELNNKFINLFGEYSATDKINYTEFIQNFLLEKEAFETRLQEIKRYPHQKTFDELVLKNERIYECYTQPQMVNDQINGRVWCFRDVTTQKRLQQQLMRQASHDALTGIPNRLLLEDRINQSIQYAKNNKNIVVVLFIDVDRFKSVNDILSHQTGDGLLKAIAQRLQDNIRPNDTVARLGGDEFIVLINSAKTIDEITAYTMQLMAIINTDYVINNQTIKITISIGISIYPRDGQDARALLHHADIAMARSKDKFGNSFHFFTEEMNNQAIKVLEIENYLSTAMQKNEITLNYQPILNLMTNEIIGVEALIRWTHPKLGSVPPQEFIAVAEATGMILPIGEWVFRTACLQLKAWHDSGLINLRMAINVSAHQFKQANIVATITNIISETNVNPFYIDVELTESSMLDSIDEVSRKMQELKALGMTLVIDDFGTGYSSLSYLKNLPVGKLKIDRSFVLSISRTAKDFALISAVIAMAKSLNFKVLAEGVDDDFQKQFLIEKGCGELQGYIFSKPLDPVTFRKFIENHLQNAVSLATT